MTDTERKTCERIATAMGYEKRVHYRQHVAGETTSWVPPGTGKYGSLPDFFTDPVAATALWEWLYAKGFDTLISPERNVANPATRWEAEVCLSGSVPMVPAVMGVGPNWMVALADAMVERVFKAALANAAGKAIEEAERVKD